MPKPNGGAAIDGQAAWAAFWAARAPYDYLWPNGINQDGLARFDDIAPFVQCLSGNCP